MEKNISKERYFEIKEIAKDCINEFVENQSQLENINFYLEQYSKLLKNDEEILLLSTMVLFPDSDKVLNDYSTYKNINILKEKYGVSLKMVMSKITCISTYENSYEENWKLKLSDIDVLDINKKLIGIENDINQAIQIANMPREKRKK